MRQAGAKIQDLWYSTKDGRPDLSGPTGRNGRGRRYRVTATDGQGKTSTEAFDTKKQAVERQRELSARLVTGMYASRSAGRVPLAQVAEM